MKLSKATIGLRVTVVDPLLNPLKENGTITGIRRQDGPNRQSKVLIETDDGDLIFCSAGKVKPLEDS